MVQDHLVFIRVILQHLQEASDWELAIMYKLNPLVILEQRNRKKTKSSKKNPSNTKGSTIYDVLKKNKLI